MFLKSSFAPNFSITANSSSLQWKQRLASLREYSSRSNSSVATTCNGISIDCANAAPAPCPAAPARRIRQHRQHSFAQHAVSRRRQKRRIHASGIGHHQASQLLQPRLKRSQLFRRVRRFGVRGVSRIAPSLPCFLAPLLPALCARQHASDYTFCVFNPRDRACGWVSSRQARV